jgi:hypothetical protein
VTHHSFAPIISAEPAAPATTEAQRPYNPPAVVYEASLEVRAGSSIGGIPDPANPLNLP